MSEVLSSAKYWNDRYLARDTGWNKGQVSPPIARMIVEGVVPKGRVLVPGAGPGHEALALARAGYPVTAVDFAEEACRATAEAARAEGLTVEVLQRDLFELPKTHAGAFVGVVEYTILCAIDPVRRTEYANVIEQLLAPGGIYVGCFYAHGRPGGPPFNCPEPEMRALFSRLEPLRLRVAPDSFPGRSGEELEFILRKRSGDG